MKPITQEWVNKAEGGFAAGSPDATIYRGSNHADKS